MANSSNATPLVRSIRCIGTIHRRSGPAVRGGRSAAARTGRSAPPSAYIGAVPGRRSVVDYSLQRRAVLADVYAGRTGVFEVCDASPYLSRAAKYHGEAMAAACPVCRKVELTLVSYVYGADRQSVV